MDISSIIPTPVLEQTSMTVSFDTDTLIATCQGAAWKISGQQAHQPSAWGSEPWANQPTVS